MDRLLHYAATAANAVLILTAAVFATQDYGRDFFIAFLMAIPPALALTALYASPNIEERRLLRRVKQARLLKELRELEAGK